MKRANIQNFIIPFFWQNIVGVKKVKQYFKNENKRQSIQIIIKRYTSFNGKIIIDNIGDYQYKTEQEIKL